MKCIRVFVDRTVVDTIAYSEFLGLFLVLLRRDVPRESKEGYTWKITMRINCWILFPLLSYTRIHLHANVRAIEPIYSLIFVFIDFWNRNCYETGWMLFFQNFMARFKHNMLCTWINFIFHLQSSRFISFYSGEQKTKHFIFPIQYDCVFNVCKWLFSIGSCTCVPVCFFFW